MTVSYFQTSFVAGPGWSPTKPPTNQIVVPTTTAGTWVTVTGMSAIRVQVSVAGS
ncbi:hypothetical protein D3C83_119160 [compost metagenome]